MRMSSCTSRVSADSLSTSSATLHPQHDHFSMLLLLLFWLLSPSVQLHRRCRTSSVTCYSCAPTYSALLLLLLLQLATHILRRAPLPNGSLHNVHTAAVGVSFPYFYFFSPSLGNPLLFSPHPSLPSSPHAHTTSSLISPLLSQYFPAFLFSP